MKNQPSQAQRHVQLQVQTQSATARQALLVLVLSFATFCLIVQMVRSFL